MHRVITHWILIATSVLVTACGPEVLYERSIATGADEEQPSWAYTDSLAYEFDVPSTDQRYDLELLVEHAEAFPYENFYLNLHTTPPNGKRTTERVSLQLSGEYGEWHGACSGGDCELAITLLERTRFDRSGRYKITLEQNSRDSLLPAIRSMGIRLSESAVD